MNWRFAFSIGEICLGFSVIAAEDLCLDAWKGLLWCLLGYLLVPVIWRTSYWWGLSSFAFGWSNYGGWDLRIRSAFWDKQFFIINGIGSFLPLTLAAFGFSSYRNRSLKLEGHFGTANFDVAHRVVQPPNVWFVFHCHSQGRSSVVHACRFFISLATSLRLSAPEVLRVRLHERSRTVIVR